MATPSSNPVPAIAATTTSRERSRSHAASRTIRAPMPADAAIPSRTRATRPPAESDEGAVAVGATGTASVGAGVMPEAVGAATAGSTLRTTGRSRSGAAPGGSTARLTGVVCRGASSRGSCAAGSIGCSAVLPLVAGSDTTGIPDRGDFRRATYARGRIRPSLSLETGTEPGTIRGVVALGRRRGAGLGADGDGDDEGGAAIAGVPGGVRRGRRTGATGGGGGASPNA